MKDLTSGNTAAYQILSCINLKEPSLLMLRNVLRYFRYRCQEMPLQFLIDPAKEFS